MCGAGSYVATAGDCDDADPAVNPDAEEVCDDIDNNCNALVDDEILREWTQWYYLDYDDAGMDTKLLRCSVVSGRRMIHGRRL